MFARQSDVIIRSDVTSGVDPLLRVFQFLVTVVACHEYTIVIFYARRRALLLPGFFHPIHLPV